MRFCPTCNCTDCFGHCAKPTDMQAIKQQHQRDCAEVDADANPRQQGECYWKIVETHVFDSIVEVVVCGGTVGDVMPIVKQAVVDGVIAGHKAACGAVDYQKELENQS